jgi:hypothetical protein
MLALSFGHDAGRGMPRARSACNPIWPMGENPGMKRRSLLMGAAALAATTGRAHAADDVVIGVVYPLTGNGAQVGLDAKVAYEVASEIINGSHAPLPMLMAIW